jgi:hypothetical protein
MHKEGPAKRRASRFLKLASLATYAFSAAVVQQANVGPITMVQFMPTEAQIKVVLGGWTIQGDALRADAGYNGC